jgi:hypothetical protein
MAASLTEKEFSRHLNTKFQLINEDSKVELCLVEVKAYRPLEHEQPGMERFSAFFDGPGDTCLPQRMYRLSHDQMGEFDIFLVPISGDQRGYRYEAVFNYYQQ